jgi:AraC-like DNA-binding protein
MRARPMISVNAATGLLEAIKRGGGDPDQILRALGLDRAAFADPDGFVAWFVFAQALEAAARATGDDCFGLHFGERFQPKDLGPLAYVVLNSPTVTVAFENAGRYLRVHNQAVTMSFAVEGERAYLRHVLPGLETEAPRQHNEYSAAVALNTIRLMAGSQWAPLEVHFAHAAPGRTSEHLRVFGAPVAFGCPTNALVMEREFVERQIPAADPRLYPIVQQYLERLLREMPPEDGLVASVRRAVAESMRDGDPTLTRVARKVAIGRRTLQRRLKVSGVDYKELVDDTRRRFALDYLRDRQTTVTEIAYLLGYSELSAFNRAFRRWTGATPLTYRRGGNGHA